MENIEHSVPLSYFNKGREFVEKILFEAFLKKGEQNDTTTVVDQNERYIASYSMIFIAVVVNLMGAYISTIYRKKHQKEMIMTREELLKLPLFLSCSLFGIFLFLNLISLEYITLAIRLYTLVYGFVSLGSVISIAADYLWPKKTSPNLEFKLNLSEGENEYFSLTLSYSDMLSYVMSAAIVIAYYLKKSWILNNIVAASFTLTLLESLTLDKFLHSFILFVGLFVYDVFWVFGTNVMLTVAKNIDAPLMFRFPYSVLLPEAKIQYAGLGLGDVAVPGLFLVFLLRFDLSKKKIDYHYFGTGMFCYVAALILCTIAVDYTGRGQPAFFYIVPFFFLGTILTTLAKGEMSQLLKFDASKINKETEDKSE
ncbi:hypothetical protein HZS_2417 [Henneguya salminicola]|nr:hypothetical protein HZS_2417 [Henneguya salminicola]